MFTVLNFLIRNPALTPAQFRAHYETSHVPLALRAFPQILEHRRYYATDGGAMFPAGMDQRWDAISAITMAGREGFDAMLAFLADPVASREIMADGDLFLDQSRCGMLITDEERTLRA